MPDYSDTDYLKSRSTRLVSTAMLVARDGEDALLDEHEDWVRTVIGTALAEEVDRYGSNERLDFHRPAQGICALIHLWRRRQLVSDRDHLLRTVARQDHAAVIAITAARESINEVNPQLIKAAVRIAFTSCRWRWHPHDEDASTREAYEKEKAGQDADAVAAEIAWLDGGLDPSGAFLERRLIHRTARGELVRSISEVVVADALHAEGIDYHYEKALRGADGVERYPDFTAEDPATGITVYWEHLGMLSNPTYAKRWGKKLDWYKSMDLEPNGRENTKGERLVTSQNRLDGAIDSAQIRQQVRDVFEL